MCVRAQEDARACRSGGEGNLDGMSRERHSRLGRIEGSGRHKKDKYILVMGNGTRKFGDQNT